MVNYTQNFDEIRYYMLFDTWRLIKDFIDCQQQRSR